LLVTALAAYNKVMGDRFRVGIAYQSIRAQQQAWADHLGIKCDKDGYTLRLDDNLYCPLSPATLEEFKQGKGDELGDNEKRGKMQALHSSSALVVNVFEYWRKLGRADVIAKACGAPSGITEIRFEQTYRIPVRGIPPHLDIEFSTFGSKSISVLESKFTEPHHRHTKRIIKEKYFSTPGLWSQLPKSEQLARRIRKESQGRTSFIYLDAPQLLKHILGLTWVKSGPQHFEILYLWYEVPSSEADRHRFEISQFQELIGDEVHFREMTYQELFKRVKESQLAGKEYLNYLGKRYSPSRV